MSSFQVALQELGQIHGHIRDIAAELKTARADDADGIHNNTGSGRVEGAIHHFFNEWSDGMHATVQNLDGLGAVLQQAEKAYGDAEQRITICAGGAGG